jgi:hypothetical protein
MSGQFHALAALLREEKLVIPIEYEAAWVPELVGPFRKEGRDKEYPQRETLPSLSRNRLPLMGNNEGLVFFNYVSRCQQYRILSIATETQHDSFFLFIWSYTRRSEQYKRNCVKQFCPILNKIGFSRHILIQV